MTAKLKFRTAYRFARLDPLSDLETPEHIDDGLLNKAYRCMYARRCSVHRGGIEWSKGAPDFKAAIAIHLRAVKIRHLNREWPYRNPVYYPATRFHLWSASR